MKHIESNLQKKCVRWFRLQYPKYRYLLFSVPNGGLRSRVEAAIMKAEGMTAGVADLILLVSNKDYHSLCIEMKTDKGRQSESQKIWQTEAERYGNKYIVVRSFDEFMEQINDYLFLT